MKHITLRKSIGTAVIMLFCLLCLTACSSPKQKLLNTANLNLDIGIGISHFDNDSDYPEPDGGAYLDVYSSKIIIRGAYGEQIIETPLIYNNSSTAHPRMQLAISGNRMYVVYCPDISLPSLQIASTDDGGENWIQSTLNLDTETIGTIDNFIASFWSTQNGALIISNGMVDTFVYFTEDAGKSWKTAEGSPPSQNWHDSLYKGVFLSATIGFATYNYYSFPPAEPQVYLTLDGSLTWNKLPIKVPASVMEAYALAGTPFYDGSKINIPIELYNTDSELVNTVYYVSFDFGDNWEFYADEEESLELIRNTARETWFEANRPEELADREYFVSDFSLYSSFNIEENVRIDAYKLIAAYNIDDWSTLHLTGNMYFDEEANLYYKDSSGFPILLFVYEGDVFEHTYYLMGSSGESQYITEGENHLAKRLYEDFTEQRAVKTLFADAREAYMWFTGYARNIYTEGSMEYGGTTYTKVSIKDITSRAQLSDYLSTLFSTELVDKLMNKYVVSEDTPLFIDGDDGLYRYGGYVGQFSFELDVDLTVSEMTTEIATLTVSADTDFYDEPIAFTYDCSVFRDSDGAWKMETFTLPEEKLEQILRGEDNEDPDDKPADTTEATVYDIADWSDLNFTGGGGEQIRQFIEAFISSDSYTLFQLSAASNRAVFDEYVDLRLDGYSISKVYSGGQSKILFEYTIASLPKNPSPGTTIGSHSLYVTVGQKGVYFSSPYQYQPSGVEKFLADYFSSTLEYTILDCSDLSYSQNLDITDFLIKRLGGSNVTKSAITELANRIFGVSGFTPSDEMLNEDGTYSGLNRPARTMDFDIINENSFGDEINVTVQFYADMSKLIPARSVEYQLRKNGDNYEFIGSYTSQTTEYKIYKISD